MEKFKFLMFILFAFTCQAKAFDYVRLQLLKCNVVDSALVTDIFNSYDEECKKLLYTFGCDGDTSSIVFIEEKMVNNPVLSIVASSISVLNFILCLILCARDVKEAIVRKFHW